MKKLLIGFAGLVVILIVAVVVIPFVVPVETYKSQLVTQTKSATGRDLKIDGDFRLSVFPSLGFVAGKVSLANAPGGAAPHLLSLDSLTVSVAFLPLLSGNIEIETFVLDRPQFNLEIDISGKPNWQFATTAPTGGTATPPKSANKAEGASTDLGGVLSGLSLGDVRLVNGKVSYSDARSNVRQVIDDINMEVALPSFDRPVQLDGSLVWNKEKISLAVALETPNSLLAAKPSKVDAKVSSTPVNFTFKGSATNGKSIQARGGVDLSVPSVRKLAAWAGSPLTASGLGFGPLKITGEFDMNGSRMSFSKAQLGFDDIKGSGDVMFDSGGIKPSVTANLQLGNLDLNRYLPPEQKAAKNGGGESASVPAGGPAATATAAGWSDEPIDLSALNSVDAKLDLAVEGIQARKIKIGQSNLGVTLRKGTMIADLAKMALYDGVGKATVTLNGGSTIPSIALKFDLSKFQALPFLTDAMALDKVEGTANADLSVTGRGRSQREIISSLNGSGKVQFLDGAIRGINLAAMLRNIKSAFLDPGAKQTQKTDFAELGGTYRINQGILTNTDLSLKSPFLRVAGAGTVDLPRQSVNYRIEPKIVASTAGQGGNQDAGGIKVPVIVSGPWSNLSYKPDLAGALGDIAKDPSKVLDGVKKLIPGKSGSGAGTSPSVPKPADVLKNLFGR